MYRKLHIFATSTVLALVLATASLRADSRHWVNGGGDFGSTSHWSTLNGGAGGSSVPGAGDSALFYPSGSYTVSMGNAYTNQYLGVDYGDPTFDLNGFTYVLTNSIAAQIGSAYNFTGKLTLLDGTVRVDSDGDDVQVGAYQGTGYLTISNGATLGGVVGQRPALYIGTDGYGTMTVNNGGTVNSYGVTVASDLGSIGSVSIGGFSSYWTNSLGLDIGYAGNGSLSVGGGASLSSTGQLNVGQLVGATGSVLVSGIDSTLSLSSSGASIGISGTGTLQVLSGGRLEHSGTGVFFIGSNSQGVGTVAVDGLGSMLTSGGEISVGEAGRGTLNVTNGGDLVSNTATIGYLSTALGDASVSGTGSMWSVGNITIGRSGRGLLTISNGGSLQSGQGTIGSQATGSGEVLVSGAGALWNAGTIMVGSLGSGMLTVADGGSVVSSGAVSVIDPAGTPTATLAIHGGSVTAHDFTRSGSGTLEFTDGTLTVVDGVFNNAGTSLTLNGGGIGDRPTLRLTQTASATVAHVGNLTIGADHAAAVEVTGGSSLQVPAVSLGAQDGGDGILTVRGNSSSFSATGDINVGGTALAGAGAGTLNVEPGANVSTGVAGSLRLWSGGIVNLNGGTLSYNAIVSNGGRINFNSGRITGVSGVVADATTLTTILGPTHELGSGREIASSGATTLSTNVDVNGGSLTGNSLSMGSNSTIEVRGGGTVVYTGGITAATGSRTFLSAGLLSPGTTLTNDGEIYLTGPTATIGPGSLANNRLLSGTGYVQSALANSASGEVRVAANERLVFAGSSNVNGGKLEVLGGELEFVQGLTNVLPTGLITARDAQLRFGTGLTNQGALALSFGTSDVFGDINNSSGAINISGGAQVTFHDDVAQNSYMVVAKVGSTVSEAVFFGEFSGTGGFVGGGNMFSYGDMRPGASPASVLYDGNLYLGPLTRTFIELGGTMLNSHDQMRVTGDLGLSGALVVQFIDDFEPTSGDSFDIMDWGTRSGSFSSLELPELGGSLTWDVSQLYTSGVLSIGGTLGVPGDYNNSGINDAGDYIIWRKNVGTMNPLPNDPIGGTIGPAHYDQWRAHFGQTAGSSAVASAHVDVPEPTALSVGVLALVASMFIRGQINWLRRPQ